MSASARQVSLWILAAFSLASVAAGQSTLAPVPCPAHVVVVVEEDHGYSTIIGTANAPYINTLASQGALFTNSFAITRPSEPNYRFFSRD